MPLAALTALLSLDAQSRDGSSLEPLDPDLFAGLEAIAVRPVVEPFQRLVDLTDQLTLTVTRPQLETELLFLGGAIVGIGKVRCLIFHMRDSAVDFDHQVPLPAIQNVAKVLRLLLAHVLFAALDDVRLNVARTRKQASRLDAVVFIVVGSTQRMGRKACARGCQNFARSARRLFRCLLFGGGWSSLAHLDGFFRIRGNGVLRRLQRRGRWFTYRCRRSRDSFGGQLAGQHGFFHRGPACRLFTLRGFRRGFLGRHLSLLIKSTWA